MKPHVEKSVKSAARALDIIEYVAAQSTPASFTQILGGLGIPRSSLFHLLSNLLARGYLMREDAGERYALGPRIRQLATRTPVAPLATTVLPFLQELVYEIDETCGFYVREGDFAVAIATATSGKSLAYTMRIGERAPLYAVSAGKIMLARSPQAEVDAYLRTVKFEPVTPATITSKRRLRQELATAQLDEVAFSREEFTIGITGIACAVKLDERVVGAFNLAIPTARFTKDRVPRFKGRLRELSRSLAKHLEQELRLR